MPAENLFDLLPTEWDYVTLGDACTMGGGNIQTGPFGSQLHASDYVPQGIPTIMPQNIGDNRVIEEGISRIRQADADRLSRYLVRPGDIVYSRRGDVERRALIRQHENGWLCGTGSMRVRFGEGVIDPLYASYYLGHPAVREWIVRHAHGATMPNLNTSILSNVPFVIPPLPEQRAIASILGALDDKIELNRRMNRTLEAIAQALFQSWFVNFDPVRAKAEGRETGLPAEIADLFPDGFVESELGQIPRGWRIEALSDHFSVTKGISYKGQHLCDEGEGLPMHNLNSVYEGGGYKHEGLKWYAGEFRERHIVRPGDVIVTNTEQGFEFRLIGYAAIVPKRYGPMGLFSHHIYRAQPRQNSPLRPVFIYWLLRSSTFHDVIVGYSNGTTVNMLPADGLQKPQLAVPNQNILEHFYRYVEPLQESIELIYDENCTLAALRDTLLPKLLSGELRVGEGRSQAFGKSLASG